MAALHYMPLFVSDYLADAAHLTTQEHGAYLLLIMTYWQRGEALPADDNRLARIARLTRDEWDGMRDTLAEFFQVEGDRWSHARIEQVLADVRRKSEAARNAGKASAERRGNARSTDVQQPLNERSTDVQPIKEKKIKGSNEPSSCPKPAPKRGRVSYPDDFEIFWKAYPTDPLMSKKDALGEWARLDTADRERAAAAAPAFKDYCDGKPDYRPVHACRFLSQRRFDGFAALAQPKTDQHAPPEAWMPSDEELRARYSRNQHEQAVSRPGSDAGTAANELPRQGAEVHRLDAVHGQRPVRVDRAGPTRVGELGSLLVGSLRDTAGFGPRGENWSEDGIHIPDEVARVVRQ